MESKMTVEPDGTSIWINEKEQLHREDGPAVTLPDGEKRWYQNGQLHRESAPAIIRTDGTKIWYLNGSRHREDGPAVVEKDGRFEWWLNQHTYTFTEWANELNLDPKTRLEMVLKWNPE